MICKQCGTDNPDSASYCRNCGYELSAIRKVPAPADSYETDDTVSYGTSGDSGYDRGGYSAGGGFDSDDYGYGGSGRSRRERGSLDSGYGGGGYSGGGRSGGNHSGGGYSGGGYGGGGYPGGGYSSAPSSSANVPAGYSADPLSMWAYMGFTLLFGIPLAGFICLIVFACGAVKNINLVNYARGLLILEIIIFVLGILLSAIWGAALASLLNGLASSY